MSITVNFGTFSKKINSTKQPTNELTDARSVYLKDSTSEDMPTFVLSGDLFDYNYCSWGNRYYFINDIRSVHNNMTEIDCVLDVLATYKTEILSGTYFVSYSSSQGNAWLADTRIPVLKNTVASKAIASEDIISLPYSLLISFATLMYIFFT